MTVFCGRARSGARSALRATFCGALAVLGLVAGGCGNNTITYGTPVITISTTPGPFTAYLVQISQITLTRSDNVVVLPFGVPEVIDFTKLNDMSELYGAPAVVEGSYVSASITVNYGGSQIFTDVNGHSQAVTVLDSTGAAATTVTYTVKFDPAHPLVIKHGVSTPLDFNFDLSASSVLDATTSPMKLTVRPVITASTQPVQTKPIRARGVFVTGKDTANAFTINARAFFDTATNPVGAVQIQTNDQTTYNVNGVSLRGAPGLAAVSALPINTIVAAYGTLGTLDSIKPNFVATEVYAGIAVENLLADRITGTVASRSGNTLHIRGAEVIIRASGSVTTGVALQFMDDLPVTVSDSTVVAVDRQPELANVTTQNISVGQVVDIEGQADFNSSNTLTDINAATGLIRLTPTTAWGTVNAGGVGSATASLVTLGDYEPTSLTFTGTGSSTATDADPMAYDISTGTLDQSSLTSTLVRFDGNVTPFGAAHPDFTATAVTPDIQTEQVLVVDWVNGGTAAPFVSAGTAGLVVNMADANLGTSHTVQTGPMYVHTAATTTDLTSPLVNPTIVADPALTGQFAIGNPTSTTALSVFHTFAGYLTQINTVLNGTNKLQKLVAVGKYDKASHIFTAYRIDIVQLP